MGGDLTESPDGGHAVNDHHLIMGRLVDYITGRIIDDTHDERYRQKLARFLVNAKGYALTEILGGRVVNVHAGKKYARVPITYLIVVTGREAMLIHYGPGSLVTRHRPALALARLATPFQIPVVVVTNGEQADVLDGVSGKVRAAGLAHIPSREQLVSALRDYRWEPVNPRRVEMEARIVMAYEVDDRCPCDDSVCRLDKSTEGGAID